MDLMAQIEQARRLGLFQPLFTPLSEAGHKRAAA
jgi:hypothetical protein